MDVTITNVYHDTKAELSEKEKIKRNRKLKCLTNSLIEKLVKNNPYREYSIFDTKNKTNCKISIETTVYGTEPRYIIEWDSSYNNDGQYYCKSLFNYYSGIIHKFVSYMNSHPFEELTMCGDLLKLLNHIKTNNDDKKIHKACNKIEKYAIKHNIIDKLL